ncbi:MAG TPA: YceD family protein [Dermatophilaceae bacterium]|jgi:uncharacterized protein
MNRLNPRLPLVFDTSELSRRPGSMLEMQRTVPAPDDLGDIDVIAIPPGQPIELELRFESVMEGVLVTGSAHATATGACVRCLDPMTRHVGGRFQELFAYADRATHHHEVAAEDEDDDDVYELVGDLFDLEPVLRDTMVPAMPFQPVCRSDCPGLCSECGVHLAEDPTHHHDQLDPRWAALQKIATPPGNQEPPSTSQRSNQEKRN